MKSLIPFLLLTAPFASASEPVRPAKIMRDAPSHEQLVERLQFARQNDPMQRLEPVEADDPTKSNRPEDLFASSDIISFNGLATLVPKRAILAAPKDVASRVTLDPSARLVSWSEFFAANVGWVTTVEVTRSQAEGVVPISQATADRLRESPNLIVATYMGGPISVLPPKIEELPEDIHASTIEP